ncbi:hypothetical protein Tco_1052915 [Tanacetum coccineum]
MERGKDIGGEKSISIVTLPGLCHIRAMLKATGTLQLSEERTTLSANDMLRRKCETRTINFVMEDIWFSLGVIYRCIMMLPICFLAYADLPELLLQPGLYKWVENDIYTIDALQAIFLNPIVLQKSDNVLVYAHAHKLLQDNYSFAIVSLKQTNRIYVYMESNMWSIVLTWFLIVVVAAAAAAGGGGGGGGNGGGVVVVQYNKKPQGVQADENGILLDKKPKRIVKTPNCSIRELLQWIVAVDSDETQNVDCLESYHPMDSDESGLGIRHAPRYQETQSDGKGIRVLSFEESCCTSIPTFRSYSQGDRFIPFDIKQSFSRFVNSLEVKQHVSTSVKEIDNVQLGIVNQAELKLLPKAFFSFCTAA